MNDAVWTSQGYILHPVYKTTFFSVGRVHDSACMYDLIGFNYIIMLLPMTPNSISCPLSQVKVECLQMQKFTNPLPSPSAHLSDVHVHVVHVW